MRSHKAISNWYFCERVTLKMLRIRCCRVFYCHLHLRVACFTCYTLYIFCLNVCEKLGVMLCKSIMYIARLRNIPTGKFHCRCKSLIGSAFQKRFRSLCQSVRCVTPASFVISPSEGKSTTLSVA